MKKYQMFIVIILPIRISMLFKMYYLLSFEN